MPILNEKVFKQIILKLTFKRTDHILKKLLSISSHFIKKREIITKLDLFNVFHAVMDNIFRKTFE